MIEKLLHCHHFSVRVHFSPWGQVFRWRVFCGTIQIEHICYKTPCIHSLTIRCLGKILQQSIFYNQVGNVKDDSDIQTWTGFWYVMIFQTFEHNFNLTTEAGQIFQNLIWHLKGRGNLNPLCWYGSHFANIHFMFLNVQVKNYLLTTQASRLHIYESRIFVLPMQRWQ